RPCRLSLCRVRRADRPAQRVGSLRPIRPAPAASASGCRGPEPPRHAAMKVSTLRLALATDRRARKTGELWVTRCLHCRAQVGLTASGAPIGTTTIEHIVPRSWFGHPAAADLVAIVGSPDDPRNLAL